MLIGGTSAHPDTIRTGPPKKMNGVQTLSGIDQLVSPRAEVSSRELPRPRGYENGSHSAHPLSMPQGQRIPSPQTAGQTHSSILPPKQQFLQVFEQFYDSVEQGRQMQSQLKDQIRKSATLLYTLSSSGQMIEGLVRSHFKEMQKQHDDKFGAALLELNSRLTAVEEVTARSPSVNQSTGTVPHNRRSSLRDGSSSTTSPAGKRS